MSLLEAFSTVPAALPGNFDQLAQHLPEEWVAEALEVTGTATIRKRRLPAEQVLWLVLGMALMRNQSVQRLAALLDIALPSRTGRLAAPSALVQARQRLGAAPLEYLFAMTAARWGARSADSARWRGLGVYAMDGTTVRVPDSPENWTVFGGQVGNGMRAGSAYPTARVVALMAVRSHVLAGMRFGSYSTGEVTLARELWADVPADSLIIVDRNFLIAAELSRLGGDGTNRHWLTRAKAKTKLRTLERFGRDDELVEIELSKETRRQNPSLPATWVARAIHYRRKGFQPSVLLTSLTDPKQYPREEVVEMYHERWEIELGYDEVKTHMLAREEAIRSRTPEGARQELWAIGLAYNLVRLEMERVALAAGVPPRRISFINSLMLLCNAWFVWSAAPLAPGRIPAQLRVLEGQMELLLLPPRRSERRYPRVVKLKMSNYDKKWVRRPGAK
jgi:Insertion element 4 transposase N-terminal/Transposase DDE domain